MWNIRFTLWKKFIPASESAVSGGWRRTGQQLYILFGLANVVIGRAQGHDVKKQVAGTARRRKTAAQPLESSRDEVSVGCAVNDFCSTRSKLPQANIEKPKLRFIQRSLAKAYNSRSATVIGSRAARMAGNKPPMSPITAAQAMPRTSNAGVTRNAKVT